MGLGLASFEQVTIQSPSVDSLRGDSNHQDEKTL